jgi:hypothetical protein
MLLAHIKVGHKLHFTLISSKAHHKLFRGLLKLFKAHLKGLSNLLSFL